MFMKWLKHYLTSVLFIALCGVSFAESTNTIESIDSFDSTVRVNTDNSVDVTENILYNTGPGSKHGIYRDMYPYSSTGKKMDITSIAVTDDTGSSMPFSVADVGENVRIKIGNPDVTFIGGRKYHISYHATYAVAQLKDIDEIYWNVTGNGWGIPIFSVTSKVILPDGVISKQQACYYGAVGNNLRCDVKSVSSNVVSFISSHLLNSKEGVTVAVGFQKGAVTAYTEIEKKIEARKKPILQSLSISPHARTIGGEALLLSTIIFLLMFWYRNWKDPKGTGVIVPQYDVPDNLSPMEVGGIVHENASRFVAAEIIYLATKGFIKITQKTVTILLVFKTTDYDLTCLKDETLAENQFDKKLIGSLFSKGKTVQLSDFRNVFYLRIPSISDNVADILLKKGYYKNLGKMKSSFPTLNGKHPLLYFFISAAVGVFLFTQFPLFFLVWPIFLIFWQLSPVKTEKGVATKEYLLGLKLYLEVAEKDRLAFHNAPEKNPEIFEKLLPYAMVFNVDKAWAKEFEGIYTTPPTWYDGAVGTNFSATMFSRDLSSFTLAATSALTVSPGGSGSGGGGSSGGGGGGGGGGGW